MIIKFENAWKNTGLHLYTETRKGTEFVSSNRIAPSIHKEFILGLIWPHADDYLQIRARYRDPTAAKHAPTEDFQSSLEQAKILWPHANLATQKFLFAPLSHDMDVELEFRLNTDAPGFIRENPTNDKSGITKQIRVVAYTLSGNGPGDSQTLQLQIVPAGDMEEYQGIVALDLGNTNSTLVCMSSRDKRMEVVDVELGRAAHRAQHVLSALRIRKTLPDEPPTPTPSAGDASHPWPQFARYRCDIGTRAIDDADSGWLVLGAKRLLSDESGAPSESSAALDIFLEGQPISMARQEPAELFVAEMLRKFYNQKYGYPQPMVITCPTTFSSSEVRKLRESVYQAWRRSRRLDNRPLQADAVKALVPQVMDEASAAGFYFLYRDFIDATGRLPGFRYLYPRGVKLLLYDCGGGTTDISLINAVAVDDRHVKIEVLGRTGHRGFGGDSITEAVFRILKAKLAAALGGPAFPSELSEMKGHLESANHGIDQKVPTQFDTQGLSRSHTLNNNHIRQRMDAALLIWKWAEQIKYSLSDTAGQGDASLPTLGPTDRARLGAPLNLNLNDARWEQIKISLEEVNALVDPGILESIRYANHLISARLSREEEVDAVYVVGNASRYPRIKELLMDPVKGLGLGFLESRIVGVRTEDLKNSVAMGALRALQLSRGLLGITIHFDPRLMDRLPYDVTYKDLGAIRDTVMFKEHTLYSQLGVREIDVPEGSTARRVSLGRCWPGDKQPEPFLDFDFDKPVKSKLLLWFNNDKQWFVMQEEGDSGPGVVGRPPAGSIAYFAPVQTGRL